MRMMGVPAPEQPHRFKLTSGKTTAPCDVEIGRKNPGDFVILLYSFVYQSAEELPCRKKQVHLCRHTRPVVHPQPP